MLKNKIVLGGLVASFLIVGCKKNQDVSIITQPEGDLIGLNLVDTLTIHTTTLKEDSLTCYDFTSASPIIPLYNLLGHLNDATFGATDAAINSQILLPNNQVNVNFGASPILDSVYISLPYYTDYYGDTTIEHNWKIERLTSALDNTKSYSTKATVTTDGVNYILPTTGNINQSLHIKKVIKIDGSNAIPQLRFKLNTSLLNSLFNNASVDLASNTALLNAFKGIRISSESTTGKGSMAYINLSDGSARISIYYSNIGVTGSKKFDFSLYSGVRTSHFTHDYTSAMGDLNNLTSGGNTSTQNVYVQGASGLKVKLDIPYISKLNELGSFGVNRAELKFTIDDLPGFERTSFKENTRLILRGIDSTGATYVLPDQAEGDAYYGGSISGSTYTFNISRYLTQLLSGKRKYYGLMLQASGGVTSPARVVLKGTNAVSDKIKMKLYLSKVK